MLAKVIVHEPEDFKTWLDENGGGPSGTPVEQGEKLVSLQGCQTCHSSMVQISLGLASKVFGDAIVIFCRWK